MSYGTEFWNKPKTSQPPVASYGSKFWGQDTNPVAQALMQNPAETINAHSTPSSLGLPQPGETTAGDVIGALRKKETYGMGNIKQTASQVPGQIATGAKGVYDFAKSLPKSAAEDLLVKPAVRTAQVISEVIKPGSAADKDVTFKAPFGLGTYNIPAQKTGFAGTKQIVGQGLNAASWLTAAPKFAALGKGVVQNAVFKLGAAGTVAPNLVKQAFWQATKAGAKNGAYYGFMSGLGSSLQEDKGFDENAKDALIGTIFGTAFGGALGAGGAGVAYTFNKTKFIQGAFERYLTDHGVSPETARSLSLQSIPMGLSIKDVSKAPGWTPDLVKRIEGLHDHQGTSLPDFSKSPEPWRVQWLNSVPESKWNPKIKTGAPLTGDMPSGKTPHYNKTYEGAAAGGKPVGLTAEDVLAPFNRDAQGKMIQPQTPVPKAKSLLDMTPEERATFMAEKNKTGVTSDIQKILDKGSRPFNEAKIEIAAQKGDLATVQKLIGEIPDPKVKQRFQPYLDAAKSNLKNNPQAGFISFGASNTIPKELKPLAKEALKYKSAEEFVKAQIPETKFDKYLEPATTDYNGTQLPETVKIYRATSGEIKPNDFVATSEAQAKSFLGDKALGRKIVSTDVSKADLMQVKMDAPYGGSQGQLIYKPKSQLTDFYNQANKLENNPEAGFINFFGKKETPLPTVPQAPSKPLNSNINLANLKEISGLKNQTLSPVLKAKGKQFEGPIEFKRPNEGLFVDYGKPVDMTKFKGQEGFFNPGKMYQDIKNAFVKKPKYAPASQKIVDIFENSKGQKIIAENKGTKFELGDFGKNHELRKLGEAKADRFSSAELKDTIANIKNTFKASSDSKNYRSDNLVHVSKMPDGTLRGIVTRLNKNGAEEIISWHNIDLQKNPNYIKSLESFGSPARNRTSINALEEHNSIPLSYGTKNSIPQEVSKVNRTLGDQIAEVKDILKQAKKGSKETERIFKGKQFNLDTEQTANLQKMQSALGLDKRTVRTFGDMTDLAQGLQTDIPSLLKNTKSLQITDAEVKGISDLIKTNTSFIKQASVDLQKVVTTADKTLLEAKVTAAENQIKVALTKLRIGNTENGRAIVANRILAQNIDNPTFWYAKAAKTLNDGGKDFTPEVRTAIDGLLKKNDLNGLALFIGSLRSPGLAEKAITLWKAGLLTSPTTHMANISGNVAFAGLENTSGAVATGFDKIASLITGKRTKSFSLGGVMQELKGAKAGVKKGWSVLKTGQDLETALTKAEIPRQVNFKNKFLDRYTKTVFGALSAEDKIFKEAALKGSLYEQARVQALNQGLKGEAFKLRVKELFTNPTDEMTMQAIDASLFRTFNNPNALATAMSSFKNSLGSGGKAATEFVAPFVRTPTNIATRMVDYSPLGFLKTIVQQIKPSTRGQKTFVEGLARNVTGTGIISLGALLAQQGLMTGNKLTDQEKAEGKVANGIKIGGRWYQITRVSPIGNLLALGAEYDKLSQDKSGLGLAVSAVAAGGQQLTQQTFLKGVSGILNTVNDPNRYGESYVEQTAGSVIPSVLGRVSKITDPKIRNPQGALESIQSKIPVLSNKLAVKRDIFGEAVKAGGSRLNVIDPFASQTVNNDPVLQEANRVKADLTMPSQTVSGVKLDNKEYDAYTKVQGRVLKKVLDELIKNPGYQSLGDDDKAKEINHLQDNLRSQVNKILFPTLMIQRYNLAPDTDTAVLTKLLTALNKEQRFKDFNKKKQADIIKGMLGQN